MIQNNEMLNWIMPSIKNRRLSKIPNEGEFNFRIEKAKQQANLEVVDKDIIIKYVNDFLESIGLQKIENPHIKPKSTEKRRINYSQICDSKEDIVWIKFTIDNYISVIGTGCDISFTDYAKNNTSSGIINQVLGKEWDDKDVLIFPLINIPKNLYRSDIESGVGNYLISKGVPILDFYSHNY